MNNYREAYLWLLAAQIPVAMNNCTVHANTNTLLLSALGEGCGCEEERVWVLGNITQHSLTVNITSAQLMWPSLTNETIVNTTIIYTEISGYPELWQLHNETLGVYLAKPLDNKYIVYYNPYEKHSIFRLEKIG